MSKQTAVEWLIEQYENTLGKSITKVMADEIEKAKAIEKEQIMDSLVDGRSQYRDKQIISAEQYYKETYGGDNAKSNS